MPSTTAQNTLGDLGIVGFFGIANFFSTAQYTSHIYSTLCFKHFIGGNKSHSLHHLCSIPSADGMFHCILGQNPMCSQQSNSCSHPIQSIEHHGPREKVDAVNLTYKGQCSGRLLNSSKTSQSRCKLQISQHTAHWYIFPWLL